MTHQTGANSYWYVHGNAHSKSTTTNLFVLRASAVRRRFRPPKTRRTHRDLPTLRASQLLQYPEVVLSLVSLQKLTDMWEKRIALSYGAVH